MHLHRIRFCGPNSLIDVGRLQNANVAIRTGGVIVQCVDGAEMVGEAIVLIVSWR